MGDRGNIRFVEETKDGVQRGLWMYTHWSGSDLPAVVHAALAKRERWDDASYLARILFCELVGEKKGTTGFGLSTTLGDGDGQVVEVHVDAQRVVIRERSWTFEEFAALDPHDSELWGGNSSPWGEAT